MVLAEHGTQFGRFLLSKRLAAGGMGEVYLARSSGTAGFDKWVVLKLLLPQYAGDRAFVEMFLDEARLGAQLHHPNITQVFELGEAEGRHYIAMEYVPGVSLETLIRESARCQHPIPLSAALRVVLEVLGALDCAHSLRDEQGRPLGLVHRDTSPSNVMVTPHGGLKLLDFGLASATSQQHQSEAGVTKGKFGYMAPEQCRGDRVDHRADLYAVGAILYHLTTGRPAFSGERPAVFAAMSDARVRPPRELAPNLEPELERILLRALARAPEDRYPDAHAMRNDLERFAASLRLTPSAGDVAAWVSQLFPRSLADPPLGAPDAPDSFARKTERARFAPRREPAPRWRSLLRRTVLPIAGAFLLLLVAGIVLLAGRPRPAEPRVSSPLPPVPGPPLLAASPGAPPLALRALDSHPASLPASLPATVRSRLSRPPRASVPSPSNRPVAPLDPDRELDRELVAINDLYSRLRAEGGEEGITGLEREAYRLALDGYAAHRSQKMSAEELGRVLTDGRRILREGAVRRGLEVRKGNGEP